MFLCFFHRDQAGKVYIAFEAEWHIFGSLGAPFVAELVLEKFRDSCRTSLPLPQDQ
jgi:hypothetical protein